MLAISCLCDPHVNAPLRGAGSTKYYVSWASGSHRTYTWDEADHECRRYGLRLVSLTSFEKEAEISKLLNSAPFRECRGRTGSGSLVRVQREGGLRVGR